MKLVTMLRNHSHLAYIVLSPVLSTSLAIINIVTIYIFCRKFRLSTLSLTVMVNICACDIFVCLISNTLYLANLLHPDNAWWMGSVTCKLFKFLTMVTNVAQIYFLCVLNADRVRRLMVHTSKQWKKRHGIVFVSVGWIVAIAICLPRIILFDIKAIKTGTPLRNGTESVSYACKPIGLDKKGYVVVTVSTFVFAYAMPACYILYTLARSQIYMWQRRRQIHMSTMSNIVTKMNNKLALTFNLTGALFMVIWTPFFILSLVELNNNLLDGNVHIYFTLRCTLLILGSAKPIIYIICLDKFRHSFSFRSQSSEGYSDASYPTGKLGGVAAKAEGVCTISARAPSESTV